MKKKMILLFLMCFMTLFLVVDSVKADQPSCNAGGGIWCNNLGSCVNSISTEPTSFGTITCDVTSSQTITVLPSKVFIFDKLTIASAITLKFVTNVAGGGCVGGAGGGYWGAAGVPNGAGKWGTNGGVGYNTCSGYGGGGVNVIIYARTFINNGLVDLSGHNGPAGGDATGDCCSGTCGCGGGGGHGGGSAGVLKLISAFPSGTGIIRLNGGSGGSGGKFTDDNEHQCNTCHADAGSGGGGGGGGAAGYIFSNTMLDSMTKQCYGGSGGPGGCPGWAESGNPGSTGGVPAGLTNCIKNTYSAETSCSDGLDNDWDNEIDMQDPDCQTACGTGWFGPTYLSVFNLIFNPISKTGFDACCGDDTLNGDFEN